MAPGGTAAYRGLTDLPPLVANAVAQAQALDFASSCRPEHGRLLQLLARGRPGGAIGETGTGCGVGLAWLTSGATARSRLISVERDAARVAAAASVFEAHDNVTVLHSDWRSVLEHGPFDLLVLDGGGAGKDSEDRLAVEDALVVGGMVVIDDFTPANEWPPRFLGRPDEARLRWLEDPSLQATEIRLAADLSAIVATRVR